MDSLIRATKEITNVIKAHEPQLVRLFFFQIVFDKYTYICYHTKWSMTFRRAKKEFLMNQFSSLFQVFLLVVAYLIITLITVIIRSVMDYRSYSWISSDVYWNYLWPRLRFWLVGVLCIAIIIVVGKAIGNDKEGMMFQNTASHLGIFIIIPMIIGAYLALCVLIGTALPFAACVQESYELD